MKPLTKCVSGRKFARINAAIASCALVLAEGRMGSVARTKPVENGGDPRVADDDAAPARCHFPRLRAGRLGCGTIRVVLRCGGRSGESRAGRDAACGREFYRKTTTDAAGGCRFGCHHMAPTNAPSIGDDHARSGSTAFGQRVARRGAPTRCNNKA